VPVNVSVKGTSAGVARRTRTPSSATLFGFGHSYLVDGTGEAILNGEIVQALRDDTVRAIARESARLPERERRVGLGHSAAVRTSPLVRGGRSRASSEDRQVGFGHPPSPAYSPGP
jgi:hypothetical protein